MIRMLLTNFCYGILVISLIMAFAAFMIMGSEIYKSVTKDLKANKWYVNLFKCVYATLLTAVIALGSAGFCILLGYAIHYIFIKIF